jgi:GTPase
MNELSSETYRAGVIALIGPPNAGKSTLLNTILGQKVAIVTPKPQTTRNRISGILTSPDRQIVFLDTPGIHAGGSRLNRIIVQVAWRALEGADGIVLLLDATRYLKRTDLLDSDLKPILPRLSGSGQPLILAVNKIDRFRDKQQLLPLFNHMSRYWPDQPFLPLSAATGEGVEELLGQVTTLLPKGAPLYPEDQVSTVPLRFMAAETIREKLFLSLRQELPYAVAVEIEQWEERENVAVIHAVIYVARDSQKGMVIGKGGALLKTIGREAREEIEELLEKKVHLELWVKVKQEWPDNPSFLTTIGVGEDHGQ